MKKILFTIIALVALPIVSYAAFSTPWYASSTDQGFTSPNPLNGIYDAIKIPYITATSTTASSTFANGINLTGGCYALGGSCLPSASNATGTPNTIVCLGDSLTQNQDFSLNQYGSYCSFLSAITGYGTFNAGIRSEGSQTITLRYLNDQQQLFYRPTILWQGYNDGTASTTVEANNDTAIAAIPSPKHFIIMSIVNGSVDANNGSGLPTYNAHASINAYEKNKYPNNYLDLMGYLLTQGDGSTGDNSDIASGTIPRSLKLPNDTVHFNNHGNYVIAQFVAQHISMLGLPNSSTDLVTYSALERYLLNQPAVNAANISTHSLVIGQTSSTTAKGLLASYGETSGTDWPDSVFVGDGPTTGSTTSTSVRPRWRTSMR